jgi:hypothetical protein
MATFIEFAPQGLLGAIGVHEVLTIDACSSQSHSYDAEVTDHPVEDGADISDHHIAKPVGLTLNGVIAYAPPRTPLDLAVGTTLLDKNRHTKAHERLKRAWEDGELVTVHTGLDIYENMAITSYQPTREVKTGYDLVFTLDLREVNKVTAQSAIVPPNAFGSPKSRQQAQKAGRKGRKPAKAGKDATSLANLTANIPPSLR